MKESTESMDFQLNFSFQDIYARETSTLTLYADQFGVTMGQLQYLYFKNKCNLKKLKNLLYNYIYPENKPSLNQNCEICQDPGEEFDCGHYFCNTCKIDYIKINFKEGQRVVRLQCPHQGCTDMISFEIFNKILSSEDMIKYQKFFVDQVTSESQYIISCTNDICNRYFDISENQTLKSLYCLCGGTICLQCNQEEHFPLSCEKMQEWINLIDKDKENTSKKYIESFSKKCPKCKKQLFRDLNDHTCNHMYSLQNRTCNCGFQFCWKCLKEWKLHSPETGGILLLFQQYLGYFNCLFYKNDRTVEKKQQNVLKLEHYSLAHEQNHLRFKNSLMQRIVIQQEYDQFTTQGLLTKDQRILQVLDDYIGYRRKLMFIQPLLYFAHRKKLFEFQVSDLEKFIQKIEDLIFVDLKIFSNEFNQYIEWIEKVILIFKMYNLNQSIHHYMDNLVNYIKDHGNDEHELSDESEEEVDDRWTCPACTFYNQPKSNTCEICNQKKPQIQIQKK